MERNPLELHRAYKRVFATPDGETIMKDLEKRGCFLGSTFSAEPGRTLVNEGRRSLVLHVKHMCDETNFIQKEN
ncbi:hypothetical protein GM415_06010 [Pseudodesulfovibrio cashew]|uniref:Bbp19-like phage domain-containing protein n=1 Tax=Pseudodesulfovibrio cashew TaxID=2678688 RepID=A0A6I6JF29_9BACT|nr:hypothetical protein [Pseudodesulfovibrio cashew]QGY39690.1 hypothetical protein GM415_06010 [Pseudodesulfovibrio cashew]